MLGSDASSECQIALGAVRGWRGPGRLPLFPVHPAPPLGTFCAPALRAGPKTATRRQCGRLPKREVGAVLAERRVTRWDRTIYRKGVQEIQLRFLQEGKDRECYSAVIVKRFQTLLSLPL